MTSEGRTSPLRRDRPRPGRLLSPLLSGLPQRRVAARQDRPPTEGVWANRLDQVACEVERLQVVPSGSVRWDWLLYFAAVQHARRALWMTGATGMHLARAPVACW